MFKGGDSLIIETNLGEGGRVVAHLHFVLLDPDEVTGNTIIVNIVSLTSPRQVQTVVLDQSERHSFLRQKSFVNYSRAMIVSVSAMRELVDRRKARLSDPIPAKLLARMGRPGTVGTHSRRSPHVLQRPCV